jgi:molybdate transport system substrate-binding protein
MKVVAAIAIAAAVAAGAGAADATSQPRLTVYAASSLTNVLPRVAPANRYSFGGSNALAAQIAQGAPTDVFAAANTKLPAQLHADRLCGSTVIFARNALVVVVPQRNPARIGALRDLTARGVKIVVAAAGVPVGDYTTKVLARTGLTKAIERNVVSRESDVRDVLAKVALGEADAGFVYATDARTVANKVKVIAIPARAQPVVAYGACVVTASAHPTAARSFIRRLLAPPAQAVLRDAGFLKP